MNIEIAPEEYIIKCTYDEALLYCFQLEIDGKRGWRLPAIEEYHTYSKITAYSWYNGNLSSFSRCRCIPVRDIL
jgi:hypothetical protein